MNSQVGILRQKIKKKFRRRKPDHIYGGHKPHQVMDDLESAQTQSK